MFRFVQFSAALVGVILFVALAGCPSSSGPATVSVKGTLTIDGQPANDVTITFSPLDSSLPTASGLVSNGSFELSTGAQGKSGAVPGKYKVVLAQVAGSAALDAASAAADAGSEAMPDYMKSGAATTGTPEQELSFPEKYTDAATSDKEVEVTSGSNDIKIEISST